MLSFPQGIKNALILAMSYLVKIVPKFYGQNLSKILWSKFPQNLTPSFTLGPSLSLSTKAMKHNNVTHLSPGVVIHADLFMAPLCHD